METVFSQISLIIPAVFVSICAVLVFVFGFKKPSPLPEFDKKLDLSETTKRAKKDKGAQNGDVKKPKKAAPQPEKKKETPKQQEEKKTAKKTETPRQSAKTKRAEETAQRKQEIKEFRELEQEGGGWNVVVSKKKTKTDDAPVTPSQEKPDRKKKEKKDNAKEIKDRANNELKNEENIKAAINEIKEEIAQPQVAKKKRARHD